MLNSRLFRLQQNQSRHFSTVLIRTNWYTISCKYFDYSVTLAGMVIVFNSLIDWKAWSPILVTPEGITNSVRWVSRSISLLIYFRLSGRLILVISEFFKMASPKVVTVDGRVNSVKLHFWKQLSPNVVTLAGISMEVSVEAWKA